MFLAVAVGAVSVASGAVLGTVSADSGPAAGYGVADCTYETYSAPGLDDDWAPAFEDGLGENSLDNWSGGRTVPVGADGDCSLYVADSETATLTRPDGTVEPDSGVVTGTLDLGANGSLRLVDPNGSRPETGGDRAATTATATESDGPTRSEATPIVTATTLSATEMTPTVTSTDTRPTAAQSGVILANDGPDFSTTAVVSVGGRSENLTLPSGRFFDFAVSRASDGTVRVAVWESGDPWDHEWDARFEDAGAAEWRVVLDGRAFLDGLAVGVSEADDPREGSGSGATESPTDDAWPGPGTWPGGGGPDGPQEVDERRDGGSGDGSIFFGVLLTGFGALSTRFAYGFARLSEQFDAIGSKTPASEVEPAEWNVALTRIVGVLLALVGLFMIASGLQ
ncbi:hypothetical protein [Halosimplex salinum]|uniref:hypothetical protein n=1 Tax=Halosimplex salinum TaxID=1710538 RepID=UPI001F2FAED4|nr:hypothetical protein [Halosimplex salinum]